VELNEPGSEPGRGSGVQIRHGSAVKANEDEHELRGRGKGVDDVVQWAFRDLLDLVQDQDERVPVDLALEALQLKGRIGLRGEGGWAQEGEHLIENGVEGGGMAGVDSDPPNRSFLRELPEHGIRHRGLPGSWGAEDEEMAWVSPMGHGLDGPDDLLDGGISGWEFLGHGFFGQSLVIDQEFPETDMQRHSFPMEQSFIRVSVLIRMIIALGEWRN
jgi:hypothetical protein